MFFVEIVSMAVGLLVVVISLFLRRWAESGWVGVQVLTFGTSYWFMSVNRAVLLWFPLFALLAGVVRWRPKGGGARAAWRVFLIVLLVADLAAIAWWGWLFGTGRWAS